jgi:O-antigen/teichoic acid export membrane protein
MNGSLGRVFKNFSLLISASMVSKATLAFVAVYLARVLGPTGFGIIAFSQAVISYFTLITDLGLKTTAMRELVDKKKARVYQAAIFTTRLGLTVVSILLFAVFLTLFSFDDSTRKVLTLYGSLILLEGIFIEWIFMSYERTSYVALAELIRNVAYGSLIFLLVTKANHVAGVPLSYAAATFLALVPLYYLLFKLKITHHWEWRPQNIWSALKLALPLGTTQILITLYYNLDHILLGVYKSKEVVGFYNAPYKIINLGLLVLNLFINSAIPFLSRLYKNNQMRDYYSLVNFGTIIAVLLFCPIGFLVTYFANEIIVVLFSSIYISSVNILGILIWSLVIMGARLLLENFLIISGAQKRYMKFAAIYFLSNLILNLLLIPRYGGLGAAVATVSADLIFFIVQVIYAPKQFFANYKIFGMGAIVVTIVSVLLLKQNILDKSVILVNTSILYFVIIFFFYRSAREKIQTLIFNIRHT